MKFVKRALKILVYLFIILLIGGYFFIRFIANRSVPDYNKKIELKGLNEEVKVSRDSFAIPHIYANNEEDLYRAVGYLMAQDRLWQMDLLRRVTQGRLSEIFGEDMVDADLFLRALRIPEKSVFLMEIASPEILSAFEAYTDGINQYIEQHIHKLPPEFAILGY
ncbi:MAG: penicillin acylase family protein, partial [Bacteroidales bacterium]|nr:penicillin acylase family protein [Bacteroidales bacterium]